MQHLIINELQESFDVAILAKANALRLNEIQKFYTEPMKSLGLKDSFVGLSLEYWDRKRVTAKLAKDYLLEEILPTCAEFKVKLLYCTDGDYFKYLTGVRKVDASIGYVLPCALGDYKDIHVVYSPNHTALFMNDTLLPKIELANKVTADFLKGTYQELGTNVIKYEEYIPCNPSKVKKALDKLLSYPAITIDTETFSLRHSEAGLGTIGFAWNKHEGICIDVEHLGRVSGLVLRSYQNQVKQLIKEFLIAYKGKLIFHNATYDIKVLIYTLWMENLLDTLGLIDGLNVLCRDFEDTKIITYLATNSCSGNKLSLKEQAHEFAGNYAQEEINDITQIKNDVLMKYNLVDCLCTWFVFEKHMGTLVKDKQEEVYVFFKKILINIIQMELTGMPIDMPRTIAVDNEIKGIVDDNLAILESSDLMKKFIEARKIQIMDEKNAQYVKKRITVDEVKYTFNPNSNLELIHLIHNFLGFDVHSTTDTGQPSVGGDELKGHMKRTNDTDTIQVISAILKILEGNKIRGTFLNKFLDSVQGPDGWHYLFGSFNLGGTKSGRLSSSKPNLQNLPSGSTYGKLVKSCFRAPPGFVTLNFNRVANKGISTKTYELLFKIKELSSKNIINAGNRKLFDVLHNELKDGDDYELVKHCFDIDAGWLFVGLDYASLEDRINALLTKDPNKLKVYTDGYDGHSLRAYAYFKSQMADIEDTVESINSIADKYPKLRSKSKGPTFALTYKGTWRTLITNCGFETDEAKDTERNYLDLYQVSVCWTDAKLEQATLTGYVNLAFGLRLRTPILVKTILGSGYTPNQAASESRTAGNAVSGQSYGLLTSRAGVEFQERTLSSEHWNNVRPSAHIHDAIYLMIRNTPDVVKWVNDNLVECVEWQELPEIQHDEVKLTGNLGIFYPNWSNEIELPHSVSASQIREVCAQGIKKYLSK